MKDTMGWRHFRVIAHRKQVGAKAREQQACQQSTYVWSPVCSGMHDGVQLHHRASRIASYSTVYPCLLLCRQQELNIWQIFGRALTPPYFNALLSHLSLLACVYVCRQGSLAFVHMEASCDRNAQLWVRRIPASPEHCHYLLIACASR